MQRHEQADLESFTRQICEMLKCQRTLRDAALTKNWIGPPKTGNDERDARSFQAAR